MAYRTEQMKSDITGGGGFPHINVQKCWCQTVLDTKANNWVTVAADWAEISKSVMFPLWGLAAERGSGVCVHYN